ISRHPRIKTIAPTIAAQNAEIQTLKLDAAQPIAPKAIDAITMVNDSFPTTPPGNFILDAFSSKGPKSNDIFTFGACSSDIRKRAHWGKFRRAAGHIAFVIRRFERSAESK